MSRRTLILMPLMLVPVFGLLAALKSYTVTVRHATQAGNIELQPGAYSLRLNGDEVVLTDKAGNRIDISAKVETGDRKFDRTSMLKSSADGKDRIVWIQLGGSRNRVVFQQ